MSDHEIEPDIAAAVEAVANRYGADGLADLIAYAEEQLVIARKALEELAAGTD